MKWVIIVGGGCIVLYLLVKLCSLGKLFKWLFSRKYRECRKRLKYLTGRKGWLEKELAEITDEIRRLT